MCRYVPFRTPSFVANEQLLSYANAFSGGVFLALAFGKCSRSPPFLLSLYVFKDSWSSSERRVERSQTANPWHGVWSYLTVGSSQTRHAACGDNVTGGVGGLCVARWVVLCVFLRFS
jgi:hypothetical protein